MIGYKKERISKYMFTLPTICFFALILLFPLLYTIYISFTDYGLAGLSSPSFVGFENYTQLFTDERYLGSLKHTALFTVFAGTFETIVGTALAVLLNREFRCKGLAKTTFLLPFAATPVAVAMVWMLILDSNLGLANRILSMLSLAPLEWLADPTMALGILIFIDVWQGSAIVTLIVAAGLSTIALEPYESAMVDGANAWQRFYKITLPLIMPTIITALILRFVEVIKAFDIIYASTKGGPLFATETMNIYAYLKSFQYFEFGSGAAIIMMFSIFVTGSSILLYLVKKKYEVDSI